MAESTLLLIEACERYILCKTTASIIAHNNLKINLTKYLIL
jgi:hypothetical protein